MTKNITDYYTKGYFESGEGSNYHNYGDDGGWALTATLVWGLVGSSEDTKPALLELGSAKGYFLKAAQRSGFDSQGLDVSDWAVSQTPSVVSDRNNVFDVTDPLPFDDEVFDVVCSWEFFEHIETTKISNVTQEAIRVLKPGGWFVHRIALTDGHMDEDEDITHVSMFERQQWETWFWSMGLDHLPKWEDTFRRAFKDRDWADRFFVYQKPISESVGTE